MSCIPKPGIEVRLPQNDSLSQAAGSFVHCDHCRQDVLELTLEAPAGVLPTETFFARVIAT